MQCSDDDIFIGFDCAYRTLGWCILGVNSARCARVVATRDTSASLASARGLFHLIAGGVEDVLGENIEDVGHPERARALIETIRRIIPHDLVARATVIIEHQPRQQSVRGRGSVRADNIVVEAQLTAYFSVVDPARKVYLIDPKMKDKISSAFLREPVGKDYAERKKQSRRAYVELAGMFDFSAHPDAQELKRVKADRSDACIQIFAAIFRCAESIRPSSAKQ